MPKSEQTLEDRKRTRESRESILASIIAGFTFACLIGHGFKTYETRENVSIREVMEICDLDKDGKVSEEEYFRHFPELSYTYSEENPFLKSSARNYGWETNKLSHINNIYRKGQLNIQNTENK